MTKEKQKAEAQAKTNLENFWSVQSLMDQMRKNHETAISRIDVEVALKEQNISKAIYEKMTEK